MDLNKIKGLKNIDNLIDIDCIIPYIHQHFMPYYFTYKDKNSTGVKYLLSKNGMILFVNGLSWTRLLIIGDIDFDELSEIIGDDNVCIYFKPKEKKPIEYFENGKENMVDFLLNVSEKDLHKFDSKNSVNRKKQNIEIKYDQKIDDITYKKLYKKWEPIDVRKNTLNKHLLYKNANITHNICYYCNGNLFAIQLYINIGGANYLLTDVKDMIDYRDYSCVCISNLLHTGNFHYMGCGKNDTDLLLHKNRICKGNYDTYELFSVFYKKATPKIDKQIIKQKKLDFLKEHIDTSFNVNVPNIPNKNKDIKPLF